ncbi:MAG: reverse transcriptase domain-containing protein, partial [Bacteroidota bacterium]|nr:reverse transcriptase domain-containing protein [Bacteroidota bacterium]
NHLEPKVDQEFSMQSYGYRPGKSAHDAVSSASANCHKYGWIIDLDIKGFFDNINHDKMMELLQLHTQEQCIPPSKHILLSKIGKYRFAA